MNTTLKKALILIAFIGFTYGAKAQYSAVPDTARFSIALDGFAPSGNFGNEYKYGVGASVQFDYPINDKLYITANAGYDMFSASNSSTNPNYIQNVKTSNMNVAPLKIGLKWFLIRTFYIQGEAGQTLLLNKTAIYAQDGSAFTWSPQMGIIFRLKQKSYIDAGIRYEKAQSFYADGSYNSMWAARVAYSFNIK